MSKKQQRKSFTELLLEEVGQENLKNFLNASNGIEQSEAGGPAFAFHGRKQKEGWAEDHYASQLGFLTFDGPTNSPTHWNLRWLGKSGEESASGRSEVRGTSLVLLDIPASIKPLSLIVGNSIFDDNSSINLTGEFEPEPVRPARTWNLNYETSRGEKLAADSDDEDSSLAELGLAAGTTPQPLEHLTVDWKGAICTVTLRTTALLTDGMQVKLAMKYIQSTALETNTLNKQSMRHRVERIVEGQLVYVSEEILNKIRWYTYEAKFDANRPVNSSGTPESVSLTLSARNSTDILRNPASHLAPTTSHIYVGYLQDNTCAFQDGRIASKWDQHILRFVPRNNPIESIDQAEKIANRENQTIRDRLTSAIEDNQVQRFIGIAVRTPDKKVNDAHGHTANYALSSDSTAHHLSKCVVAAIRKRLKKFGGTDLSTEEVDKIATGIARNVTLFAKAPGLRASQQENSRALEFIYQNVDNLRNKSDQEIIRYMSKSLRRWRNRQDARDKHRDSTFHSEKEHFRSILKRGFAMNLQADLDSFRANATKTASDSWFRDQTKELIKQRKLEAKERKIYLELLELTKETIAVNAFPRHLEKMVDAATSDWFRNEWKAWEHGFKDQSGEVDRKRKSSFIRRSLELKIHYELASYLSTKQMDARTIEIVSEGKSDLEKIHTEKIDTSVLTDSILVASIPIAIDGENRIREQMRRFQFVFHGDEYIHMGLERIRFELTKRGKPDYKPEGIFTWRQFVLDMLYPKAFASVSIFNPMSEEGADERNQPFFENIDSKKRDGILDLQDAETLDQMATHLTNFKSEEVTTEFYAWLRRHRIPNGVQHALLRSVKEKNEAEGLGTREAIASELHPRRTPSIVRSMQNRTKKRIKLWWVYRRAEALSSGANTLNPRTLLTPQDIARLQDRIVKDTKVKKAAYDTPISVSDMRIDCFSAIGNLLIQRRITRAETMFIEDWLFLGSTTATPCFEGIPGDIDSLKQRLGLLVHAQIVATRVYDKEKHTDFGSHVDFCNSLIKWVLDGETPTWTSESWKYAESIILEWNLPTLVPEAFRQSNKIHALKRFHVLGRSGEIVR